MKKIIILILLNISFSVFAQNKSQQFIYNYTFQEDSTDINSKHTEKMYLFVSNNQSEFISYGAVLGDSLKYINDESKIISAMQIISKHKVKSRVYKLDSIITTDWLISANYKWTEPMRQNDWKITDNTKSIAGYKCQKATTQFAGRDYIAWFTIEIPISDGPYKFNGLPGLIIEIHDIKNQHIYSLMSSQIISFRKINIIHNKVINTNKCDYFKLKKDTYQNISKSTESAGIKISFDENAWREVQKAYNKRNNPIELKCSL